MSFTLDLFWNWLKSIPVRIKKILEYSRLLWKDTDRDYESLLKLEKMKLIHMEKYFSRHGFTRDNWVMLRDIRICIRLIDIITIYDSSYDYDGSKFTILRRVNVKNSRRFLGYDINEHSTMTYLDKDDLRIQKAWTLYCMIRKDKMKTWWI